MMRRPAASDARRRRSVPVSVPRTMLALDQGPMANDALMAFIAKWLEDSADLRPDVFKSTVEKVKDAYDRMATYLLALKRPLLGTKSCLESMVNVPLKYQGPFVQRLADTIVLVDRWRKQTTVRMITGSAETKDLIRYIEAARQDETPMEVGINFSGRAAERSWQDHGPQQVNTTGAVVLHNPSRALRVVKRATKIKTNTTVRRAMGGVV